MSLLFAMWPALLAIEKLSCQPQNRSALPYISMIPILSLSPKPIPPFNAKGTANVRTVQRSRGPQKVSTLRKSVQCVLLAADVPSHSAPPKISSRPPTPTKPIQHLWADG